MNQKDDTEVVPVCEFSSVLLKELGKTISSHIILHSLPKRVYIRDAMFLLMVVCYFPSRPKYAPEERFGDENAQTPDKLILASMENNITVKDNDVVYPT